MAKQQGPLIDVLTLNLAISSTHPSILVTGARHSRLRASLSPDFGNNVSEETAIAIHATTMAAWAAANAFEAMMLRRNPSKIEVKLEDKEELEDSRKRAAASSSAAATSLLHHFDRTSTATTTTGAANAPSKSHRIGLHS
ncbi:hypothetical protein RJ639_013891 [Escallonia herrerae]|uniref:Uncharacterized protein n=1 Tax=Escallonia herrerae TaxID=1293975 RepID=A0AA88VG40_9ASTE|nr:hypothetical protein RJ639_013891 [Escallonia herrerae]